MGYHNTFSLIDFLQWPFESLFYEADEHERMVSSVTEGLLCILT